MRHCRDTGDPTLRQQVAITPASRGGLDRPRVAKTSACAPRQGRPPRSGAVAPSACYPGAVSRRTGDSRASRPALQRLAQHSIAQCLPLHASQARCLGPRHAFQRVGDRHHARRRHTVRSWRLRLRNSAADSVPQISNRMPSIVVTHQDWQNPTRPIRAATNHTRVNDHA
jgi:hypothetical protein